MRLEEVTQIEKLNDGKTGNVVLTVWVLAYNHAQYIGQALDHILSQKTNFKFDIMIFDDASDDGTSEIVREYAYKYPDIIRAYILEKNTFHFKSRIKMREAFNREHIKAKYIALCEGDDYWTDDNKLQMQVDFLEKNELCVMTIHSARRIDCRDNSYSTMQPFTEGYVSIKDLIMETSCIIPVASIVCRSDVFLIKDDFPEGPVGDKKILLNAIMHGKVYYFDREMSVYRYMHANSWSLSQTKDVIKSSEMNLKLASFFMEFDKYSKSLFKPFPLYKAASYICSITEDSMIDTEELFQGIYFDLCKKFCFLKPLKMQLFDMYGYIHKTNYLGRALYDYCDAHEYIYVYGAGQFGRKMYSSLKTDNINVNGYVVSDEMVIDNRLNNIYKVSQIDFAKDVGIVVAVNNRFRIDIENVLNNVHCNDYYAPFWL